VWGGSPGPSHHLMYQHPDIDGWMTAEELEWLYERSREMSTVVEIGSYNGRSTHALLSGGAHVTAIDHFQGSAEHALTNDTYQAFVRNVGHFPNLAVLRMPSLDAAQRFADRSIDMVFIDADHSYEAVKADILAWAPKARRILCGHDYGLDSWPGVTLAVRELIGSYHVYGTIWFAL